MGRKIKELFRKIEKYYKHKSIQFTIALSFTVVAVICMGFIGVMLYGRFLSKIEETTLEGTKQVLNQTSINLETYLRSMMRISDSMYYSVIKNTDISENKMDIEMKLLYEANKDNLISIACFTRKGELVGAAPIETVKPDLNIVGQEWFIAADQQMENLHFSTPHVQNLFDDSTYRYYWVVSLSRVVELTSGGNNIRGVLLVDMNYSSIEQLFKKANSNSSANYIYLIDNSGEIIYHPRQKLIYSNLFTENNRKAAEYEDGSHYEVFENESRMVTVKTVGYTGWKIVSVAPHSSFSMGMNEIKYFVILIVTLTISILILANQFVSAKIAKPIKELENSVKALEDGDLNMDIYVGGSHEIQHLGKTLRSVVAQLKQLMDDIVIEQEEKRKTELDALQSQINPHFLYNTLDSIVWMIEGERYDEAIFMVTELASLFRISLSKGKNVISIEDELKHARNYMNIQKVRYKNKFTVTFAADKEILDCSTIKLVVQPILENAIYYGMEYMDGEGEILVRGYRQDGDVYLEVADNGLGIPEDMVKLLLTDNTRVRRRGSGVGLINVHTRIRLRYGEPYGLEIESIPDEGTTVRIHLPYLKYGENNKEGSASNEQ